METDSDLPRQMAVLAKLLGKDLCDWPADKSYLPPCVISPNAVGAGGYAKAKRERFGKTIWAHHILAWVDANGRLPRPGMVIRHLCDVRNCIEPLHLVEGTQRQNVADMVRRGRAAFQQEGYQHPSTRKTHCKRGHPFNEKNTYWDDRGRRICKACQSMHGLKWLKRKVASEGREYRPLLRDAEIDEIVALHANGTSPKVLAEAFDRSVSGIYFIIKREAEMRPRRVYCATT